MLMPVRARTWSSLSLPPCLPPPLPPLSLGALCVEPDCNVTAYGWG